MQQSRVLPPAPAPPVADLEGNPVSEEFEGEDPSVFSRLVVTSEDGTETVTHEWRRSEVLNRYTGPAQVTFEADGSRTERWYLGGNLSRLDGPAVEIYGPEGNIAHREFYLFGNRIKTIREIGDYLGSAQPEMRDFFLDTSPYRVFIDEGVPTNRLGEIIGGGVNSVAGVRRVLEGTPIEWVAAYEEGSEG